MVKTGISLLILSGLVSIQLRAQLPTANDSLKKAIALDEVTVTATKTNRRLHEIAAKVDIIGSKQIENLTNRTIDDLLRFTSGVNVNRTAGNYTMRPAVTLRNLGGDEQGRTLVLLNGMPMNTSDEGGVNWNRINAGNVKKIEVFKGSGSSLYGNNAMGGVINIITRKPVNPFEANVGASYGTFNTFKPEIYLGGNLKNKLSWMVSGFYQKSDGYNPVPESKPEYGYSVTRFLKEGGTSASIDYKINDLVTIVFQYDYYRDKRGEGEKIHAPDGEYRNFNTNLYHVKASGQKRKFDYQFNIYFQREHYYRIDERMKGTNYTRFDAESDRNDYGAVLNTNYAFTKSHTVTFGLEMKDGSVNGGDYYKTSADVVLNKGSITSTAFYLQDELKLFSRKLSLTTGMRVDKVRFHDGAFSATGTGVDYWTAFSPSLTSHSWVAISPRAALRYHIVDNLSAYVSYSRGFRASILDDLCRSGYMWVGPKVANPELGPEYLDNVEAGLRYSYKKILLEPSIYYSLGKDFLYYVANGDTISNRPVYRRENITRVGIRGAEIDARFDVNSALYVWANYSYATSEILQFRKNPALEGKSLKYAPNQRASAGFVWLNNYITTGLGTLYKGKQYTTDNNSTELDSYFTMDLQFSHAFLKNRFITSLSIQDLFDNSHMEIADYLSPGRIIMLKIYYKLGVIR